MFSYASHGAAISPFLLLDYAGPAEFAPAEVPRGVGEHSHRGFETVTIVYQGEVEHLDSTGAGGRIGPGDVQWMTAASGILHQEFHSEAFTRRGGTLEMVQLWVNLPAATKMAASGYQTLPDQDIPAVRLLDAAGTPRVIAGEFDGHVGPSCCCSAGSRSRNPAYNSFGNGSAMRVAGHWLGLRRPGCRVARGGLERGGDAQSFGGHQGCAGRGGGGVG